MQRANGFYWVKMSWGEWTIEQWKDGKWVDHGCQDGNAYYVSFFQEIDERRIERTKKDILSDCSHCDYTGECQQSFVGGVCRRTGTKRDNF